MIDFPSGGVFLTNEILKQRTLLLRMKPNIRAPIFPNTDRRTPRTSGYYLFILFKQTFINFIYFFSPWYWMTPESKYSWNIEYFSNFIKHYCDNIVVKRQSVNHLEEGYYFLLQLAEVLFLNTHTDNEMSR